MTAACEQHRPGSAARAAARLGGRVPMIDTTRLQLRGPRIYDFKAFSDIFCSDRAEAIGGPFARNEAWSVFSQYTAQWMLHGHGLWTVDAQTQPSAGFVLLGYEYDDPEAELAVYMTEEAESNGYAFEAAQAARAYAFDTLRWDSVVSYLDASNSRANALMLRLGAVRDMAAETTQGDGTQIWRHARGAA